MKLFGIIVSWLFSEGGYMRILHCADIHLDSKLNSNLDQTKSIERRHELLVSFKNMIDYAANNNIEAVIIAGDLFDSGDVSRKAIMEVENSMCSKPQITFYYLRGNHDESEGLSTSRVPNLRIFGNDWSEYCLSEELGIKVYGATNPSSLPALSEEDINIVVLHGQIVESTSGGDISLPDYRHQSIDYLALGHIHRFIMKKLDERGVYCYPGCLESRGFDESEEHGFVVLDIDERKQISRSFISWGKRKVYKVSVDISGCTDNLECMDVIRKELKQKGVTSEDMVEVILTGELSEVMRISSDYIYSLMADEYYCVKLKDSTKIRIDINEYTRDISLKSEFIKMVMDEQDIDEDTKMEIIKTGLLALAGEAI